ncbi:inositol monophosphatase family protein [Shouchella sp. JSM 1781072]|uniref:inositol monophosphatase family protein n=1 Tax=Bacillaceae TaxID=186817 RepID=UPI000C06D118|nr:MULTISPECIES: inositol monophosphatase family protein [Bacillaceae]UTR04895.1 inositol monophosphatase family protein [Alkalihalobacillus sp. LMS6]
MDVTWREIEQQAKEWIFQAGEQIKDALNGSFAIETKSNPDDLVTDIDKSTEAFLYKKIRHTYPEHRFLGEEGVSEAIDHLDGIVWIVDPIDGTMNFVHQRQNFAISIGIYENGIGKIGLVYDVMKGELFHANDQEGLFINEEKVDKQTERPLHEAIIGLNSNWLLEERQYQKALVEVARNCRGTRSYGSAALEMAYVAVDRIDAYISLNLSPWDYAGGAILLREAGGISTRLDNQELSFLKKGTVLAAKKELHPTIIEHLQEG